MELIPITLSDNHTIYLEQEDLKNLKINVIQTKCGMSLIQHRLKDKQLSEGYDKLAILNDRKDEVLL